LKIFTTTSDVNELRKGKEIFVSAFSDFKSYEAPNEYYLNFIRRKYTMEGLKFSLSGASPSYAQMLRIYAIDVVHTSLFMDRELIRKDDLVTIFTKFVEYTKGFDQSEQMMFRKLRMMILNSGSHLAKYEFLFESLYSSFLHCVQYYTNEWVISYPNSKETGKLYNSYVDYMLAWSNRYIVNKVWRWEPNSSDFRINIMENYVFFKIINLVFNMKGLDQVPLKFEAFIYQNHHLIHDYLLEEEPRRLVNFIRNNYFPNKGFNYKNFVNLELGPQFAGRYVQYANNDRILQSQVL
jgi:hypothetical protein